MPNVVDRLSGAASSLALKAPCRLATTANITLSGYQTIDGTLPTSSEHVDLRRILVKNQTSAAENGIYIMDTGTWERTKDFDGVNDIRQGTRIYVFGGSTQSGNYIVTSSVDPSTFAIDTTSITITAVGTFDQTTSALGIDSGGVILFNSGDVTITHSSSALAFAGAGAGFSFAESVTLSSALNVSGAAALSGAVTLSSAVSMTGAVTASSAVTMSGAVTMSSAVALSGAVTLSSAVSVTGTLTASSASTVAIQGAFTSSAYTASGLITGSAGVSVNSSFTSSGNIHAVSGTTITQGGVAGKAIFFGGSTTVGIYFGSSAPAIAAGQGSWYIRTDGGSSLTRAYIQSSGSTNTWVGLLTTA